MCVRETSTCVLNFELRSAHTLQLAVFLPFTILAPFRRMLWNVKLSVKQVETKLGQTDTLTVFYECPSHLETKHCTTLKNYGLMYFIQQA